MDGIIVKTVLQSVQGGIGTWFVITNPARKKTEVDVFLVPVGPSNMILNINNYNTRKYVKRGFYMYEINS